jgi:hypothetical protein
MTAPLRQQRLRIDPVAVFIARAEARAMLWAAAEITLHEALDELWAAAVRDGLVARLGVDEVQKLLATAFALQRDDLPRDEDVSEPIADDEHDGLSPTFTVACRKADKKQRRKPADPAIERVHRLLSDDVSFEKAWNELNNPRGVPIATLHAAEYLLQLGDLERWKKWFDAYSAPERATILQHLEQRKRRRGK